MYIFSAPPRLLFRTDRRPVDARLFGRAEGEGEMMEILTDFDAFIRAWTTACSSWE